MVEGVASFFGSSATSSLGSGHDGVETSSVVLDVVSISILGSGSEMIGSEFMVLSVSSVLELQLPQPYCRNIQISMHYLHIPDSQAHCTLIGTDGISAFSRTSSEYSTP